MAAPRVLEGFRLSAQQRWLWRLQKQDGSLYRTQSVAELEGPLDAARLRRALEAAVARHEVLRTLFLSLRDVELPVQAVQEELPFGWREGTVESSAELDTTARSEMAAPFDVAAGPVLRCVLIQQGADRHGLVLTTPALVADDRSHRNLVVEILSHLDGVDAPDAVQYADYCEWQHELLQSERAAEGRQAWRRMVGEGEPGARLPFSDGGRAAGGFLAGSLPRRLDRDLATGIARVAAELYLDVGDVLWAAWSALLWRYLGVSALPARHLHDGRKYEDLRGACGPFAKFLPASLRISAGLPFLDLARQVERLRSDAGEWEEYFAPGEGEVGPSRPAEYGFAYEPGPRSSSAGGLRLTWLRQVGQPDRCQLDLRVFGGAEGLALELAHDAACFSPAAIERMADQLEALLASALEDPTSPVGDLALLGREERRVWDCCSAGADLRVPESTIHESFQEQAAATPDRVAVVMGQRHLSFGEVERRAERLSARLRCSGVGVDDRVALVLERSPRWITSLLGVLKAGAAFVPVSVDQPAARLRGTLDEGLPAGRPRLAVADRRSAAACVAAGVTVIDPDGDGEESGELAGDPGPPRTPVDALAYVLFTSGSTGRPKGVMVSHRSVGNLVAALEEAVYAPAGAASAAPGAVGLNAPLAFDASIKQVVQLLRGRGLVLVPEEVRPDGESMLAELVRQRVEALDCTPSQLAPLLEAGLLESPVLPLAALLVGGEAIEARLWRRLAEAGRPRFFNVYGPTECTVDATVRRIEREAPGIDLGRPIANATVRLLDPRGWPAPVEMPGEVCIGGAGVARGYAGYPGLTARRFVPDPYVAVPGARLYRSGDLAVRREDGRLETLGRIDHQIKLRGVRIEPAEIEDCLEALPEVRQAVVVLRHDTGATGAAGGSLVAYVAPRRGSSIQISHLRARAREGLPEAMVPSAFVVLERLPLSANGKVDRAALPRPDDGERTGGDGGEPASPIEELLAGLWSELLGRQRVGVEESFFELGGHSLLVTQLMSRVRETCGVELPVRSLFEEPTVAGLATRVEAALRLGGEVPPPIGRVPREGTLPLSFAQQRLWFLDRLEPGSPLYNMAASVEIVGRLASPILSHSLDEIVRRHEVLRTVFREVEDLPCQRILPRLVLPLPHVDLSRLTPEALRRESRRLSAAEATRPFDLTSGPLLRVLLLIAGTDRHTVLVTVHHAVSDGWSIGVLFRELTQIYPALAEGRPVALPELPIQYADFAAWQREWLQGDVLDAQLAYWRQQLDFDPPAQTLPLDRLRPARPSRRGALVDVKLPAPLAGTLHALSRQEGATLFMTLLTAFQVLLWRYGGRPDPVVGVPIANRNQRQIEGLIGFFVNTLAVRGVLDPARPLRRQLAATRESLLGAYAHQDLPFEKLVEEVNPERSLDHSPLFQVMFVLQNTPRLPLDIPGLGISPPRNETRMANFDLTLSVDQAGDELTVVAEYSTDLFDAATMRRLLRHFHVLLTGIAHDPQRPLAALPLLGAAEEHQLLREWNDRTAPGGGLLDGLFLATAAARPDAVAVEQGGRVLTYAELRDRSRRLADRLAGLGVDPEVRVALYLERTPELAVGLLAVLAAGGTCVPLDPEQPDERLRFILEDSAAPLLLTESRLLPRVPSSLPGVVCLDDPPAPCGPRRAPVPENAAYAIYTSGSTGRPKAVLLPHRALADYALEMRRRLELGAGDRFLQLAALGFDVVIEELFPAWAAGAAVVLPEGGEAPAPAELADQVARHRVTLAELPAAYWHEWLDLIPAGPPSPLRALLVGCETPAAEGIEGWDRWGVPLVHVFGLTETAVTSTLCEVPASRGAERLGGRRHLPIGRPVAGAQVHLLDAGLRPVPAGLPGGMSIGGGGLGRGYLGRPGLTAERFVPHPFAGRPGARLYATGDLARLRSDGEIEYLGRMDRQINLRGHRIEPAEVEAALTRHPAVAAAAVATGELPSGDPGLVAWVVPATAPWETGPGRSSQVELWPAQGDYGVYDDVLYLAMADDEVRNASYRRAMRELVPGKVCVDVGTGAELVLTRFCLEAGAARVYAIEMLDESYRKAQARIEELGIGDRVVLVKGRSTEVELPEKADVVVSELIGTIGGSEGAIPLLNDARRFLKPGGVMIPVRCRTAMAAVSLPPDVTRQPGFTEVPGAYVKKVFERSGRPFDLRLCIRNFPPERLLTDSAWCEDLDFSAPVPAEYRRELDLTVERDGRVDGLLAWIVLETIAGDVVDVLRYRGCWSPAYYPVFHPGVEVRRGDRLELTFASGHSDDPVRPDYSLEGRLLRAGGDPLRFDYRAPFVERAFRGNGFYRWLFPSGEVRIVDNPADPSERNLRAHLRSLLPEPMVPSAIVAVEALPRTVHGKVDFSALPEPDWQRGGGAGTTAGPTPVEEVLAGIWSSVLGVPRIDPGADFFELGGHSLLATQVVSRVRRDLGVEVPLRRFFEQPRVAALAQAVEEGRARGEAPPPLERAPEPPPGEGLPLSYAQRRLWSLARLQPDSPLYNLMAALHIEGSLALPVLQRTLSHVVRRHEVLRTVYPVREGDPVQRVLARARVELPVVDLSALPDARRHRVAQELAAREAAIPFDLAVGPVLRTRLLRLAATRSLLLLSMHHIASDAWSTAIFIREVSALYRALSRGERSPLQELPLQYGDYARWQRRWLRGPVLDAHLDYWRRRLEDAPPPLELPTDRPRPVEATHRGATRRVVLPAALSEDLRTLSRQEGVTLFMTLLAGFQALLSLRTGHTDVVVGTDVANRNAAECEALIGFFVNQLVLRTDLAGDPTFRTLLGRVREVALGAYDHQDLPFDDLVKALRPDRDLGRHPLFHVKFVLQNAPSPEMELDGLVLHPLPLDRGTAKFDLLLDLEDTGAALAGRIEYSTDLFDEGTVVGLFEQWHRLLASAARRPGARLSELGQSLEAEVAQARAEMGRRLGEVGVARLRTARRRQATGIAP